MLRRHNVDYGSAISLIACGLQETEGIQIKQMLLPLLGKELERAPTTLNFGDGIGK